MPAHRGHGQRGRQCLPRRTVLRLLALVDGGMSYRRTAGRLGCHRNTVYRLIRDRSTPKIRRRLAGPAADAPAERCGGCGQLVDLPCVVCAARQAAQAKTARRRALSQR